MWSTYKVHEPLHMQWMGIWNHRQPVTIALVDPDFDSRLKAWVTLLGYKPYHYRMQWLRLHTHPKLLALAHQCGTHIRCMNRFICSGWAYGLDFWLTFTNLGNICGGNGVNVHPYAHPQQLKVLKHLI
jgi:hypothetical protein